MLFSDIAKTNFMQAADVFEKWKVLVEEPISLEITVGKRADITLCLDAIRQAHKEDADAKFKLIAIWVPNIEEGAWCDPDIKVMSTGKKWGFHNDRSECG